MSTIPDSPSHALGELLSDALERSVDTSLTSLESLQTAVRSYTRHQKNLGVSLDSIMRAISSVLMEAEDDRIVNNGQPLRDPKLASQLRAWCGGEYSALE